MKYLTPVRWIVLATLVFVALAGGAASNPASAWWRGGVAIGIVPPPLYFGGPVYAPPPVYYAPPPVYYAAPPAYYAPPPVVYAPPPFYVAPPSRYSSTCYAGAYSCPMQNAAPAGSPCSCPANQGRAYGRAG